MATTADYLTQLQTDKQNLVNNLVEKGVEATSDETFTSLVPKVLEIESSSILSENDVNLYDYDGRLLYSYTKDEFLALSELPTPTISHEYLTFEEWNWSLSGAQSYVGSYGVLDIGATYQTSDGKTHIFINIKEEYDLEYSVSFACSGTLSDIKIYWGDDTEPTIPTTSGVTLYSHLYDTYGVYHITIEALNDSSITIQRIGSMSNYGAGGLGCFANQTAYLIALYMGNNVYLGDYAAHGCLNLERISLRNSVNSYAMSSTRMLKHVNLHRETSTLGINVISGGLQTISLSENITSLATSTFSSNAFLRKIQIPPGVTTIPSQIFSSCSSLYDVVIPVSVKSIGQRAFQQCKALAHISLPTSLTRIYSYAFNESGLIDLEIPQNVTTIDQYAFTYCRNLLTLNLLCRINTLNQYTFSYNSSLTAVSIPNSVTKIDTSAFITPSSLRTIEIPSSVTSIGTYAFYNCYALKYCYMKRTTPPSLSSNTFSTVPTSCIIYVPYSEDHSVYNAYTTASIWSTYADKMREYDYDTNTDMGVPTV